jgi:hypothetical protein
MLFFIFKIVLVTVRSHLRFCRFSMGFSISAKNVTEILIEIALNLQIILDSMNMEYVFIYIFNFFQQCFIVFII